MNEENRNQMRGARYEGPDERSEAELARKQSKQAAREGPRQHQPCQWRADCCIVTDNKKLTDEQMAASLQRLNKKPDKPNATHSSEASNDTWLNRQLAAHDTVCLLN